MAAKVIKGPFDGPGPKEPEDVAATFWDAEGDPFTVRDAGPDGEIQIDCKEFADILLTPEILEFLMEFSQASAQRFEDGYYDLEDTDD
jgi:hypothetical protein